MTEGSRLPDKWTQAIADSGVERVLVPCEHNAAAFRDSGRSGLMTVFRNEGLFDTSNVEFADGRIVRYDKKARTPAMRHIDWGLGVLKASAFARYPAGEPLDLARVYQDLLAADELTGYEVSNRFYEIGSPEGLAETDAYLRGRPGVL